MKNILVLCTGNSCRSQIAHGYFQFFLKNKANIYSAGIETHGINKYAVKVMSMDSIDIENNTSNLVDEYVKESMLEDSGKIRKVKRDRRRRRRKKKDIPSTKSEQYRSPIKPLSSL